MLSDPKIYTCESCEGSGGFDASSDCEVYDDWIDCLMCGGSGEVSDD